MDKNPYLARLRELAPDIDNALEAEFPHRIETRPAKANLRPLDPFAAYLVLISKMGALLPALAACCAVLLAAPLGAPLPPIAEAKLLPWVAALLRLKAKTLLSVMRLLVESEPVPPPLPICSVPAEINVGPV